MGERDSRSDHVGHERGEMTTTLSFIIVLGVLVFVHELGHFLVAKALGVGVDRFSIGFPPKMFGFKYGETEYCISWIPLGGYVKLHGEDPSEPADPNDPRLYSSRPPRQRAGIVTAGPIMNLTLSFVLMPLVFIIGMNIPAFFESPVQVGWVVPDSVADVAGVKNGDLLIRLGNREIVNWEDLFEAAALVSGDEIPLEIDRTGEHFSVVVPVEELKSGNGLGVLPPLEPVIGSLTPGYPAVEAGLMEGDRILSVGGLPVSHWNEMAQIIHGSPGKSVTIEIDREGKHHTLTVMPRLEEKSGRGLVGISPENETISRRYPVLESISRGFKRNVELLGLTFKFIWDLLTFNTSLKLLGGPIMIFQVTGEVARAGISEFIAFMAFLSLQLGVLNLLPIPVLDGGHLLFLGLEGIKGRPLEPRFREMAQRIGFFLLLLLILVVSYNDILRILTSR